MIEAKRVASGTYGEVWWNGDKIAEVCKFESKYTKTREDVPMCQQLATDSKMTSYKGSGSMTLYKVYSRWADYADALQEGKDERATMIGKVADPDSPDSAIRVALYNVGFDEIPLVNFEAGKVIQETVPFTFTGHKFLS